ncbi:hypothetical protein B0H13DRAFT_2020862, partial [Mycena leptocephala]
MLRHLNWYVYSDRIWEETTGGLRARRARRIYRWVSTNSSLRLHKSRHFRRSNSVGRVAVQLSGLLANSATSSKVYKRRRLHPLHYNKNFQCTPSSSSPFPPSSCLPWCKAPSHRRWSLFLWVDNVEPSLAPCLVFPLANAATSTPTMAFACLNARKRLKYVPVIVTTSKESMSIIHVLWNNFESPPYAYLVWK